MAVFTPTYQGSKISAPDLSSASAMISRGLSVPGDIADDIEKKRLLKIEEDRRTAQDARQATIDAQNAVRFGQDNEMFKYKTDEIIQNQADKARTEYTQGVLSQALMQEKPLEYIKKVNETEGGFNATVSDMTPILSKIRSDKQDAEDMRRFNIQNARQAAADGRSATLFDLQKEEYADKKNSKANYANFVKSLDTLSGTKEVTDKAAEAAYNTNKNALEARLNGFQNSIKRYTDNNLPVPDVLQKEIDKSSAALNALTPPSKQVVKQTKEEYAKDVTELFKNLPKDPVTDKSAVQLVEDRIKLLYPEKTEGFTPYQQYQIQQDQNKQVMENKDAFGLAQEAFGVDAVKKMLEKNPNLTSTSLKKLATDKLEKNKDYKAGSLTNEISKMVTDGDTDSDRNIYAYKADLEDILKNDFKNNKADMVQAIKGYYNIQGTGINHNWGNSSPIGDALDNFISKYKK